MTILYGLPPFALSQTTPSQTTGQEAITPQSPSEHASIIGLAGDSPCFPAAADVDPDLNHCDAIMRQAGRDGADARTLASAHNNRGLVFAKSRRWEEALQAFDAALALQPELSGARLNRGNALLESGQYAQALDDYDAVVASGGPLSRIASFNRSFVRRAMADLELAAEDLDSALSP